MNETSLKATSVLGFGTASISSMKSYADVTKLLKTAYREGITHFDTAPLYGRGYSEKMLGDFAKDKRSRLQIATKFGLGNPGQIRIPPQLALPLNYYRKKWSRKAGPVGTSAISETSGLPFRLIKLEEVKNSLEGSLGRLQTTYIDYYLLHEALPGFLEAGVLEYLVSQKKQGRVRHIGVATGAINLAKVNAADFKEWDVLQYEAGVEHKDLKERYPDKLHFLHSVLKNMSTVTEGAHISFEERGGYLLAQQSKVNAAGKILFSTRRKKVLHNNVIAFKKYST